MHSIRRATFPVGRQSVWCERNVCRIRNVTFTVLEEKVCSTRRVASPVWGEDCAVSGDSA